MKNKSILQKFKLRIRNRVVRSDSDPVQLTEFTTIFFTLQRIYEAKFNSDIDLDLEEVAGRLENT